MDIIKMLTKKKCYVGQNKPAYVVIHETDNWGKGADANAHARAMSNGNLDATVHYYVDSKSIYQTLEHSLCRGGGHHRAVLPTQEHGKPENRRGG